MACLAWEQRPAQRCPRWLSVHIGDRSERDATWGEHVKQVIIARLGTVFAVTLLFLLPVSAVASTAIFPGDENNRVELSGVNNQGERTVRVKQTTTNSDQFVFHIDLITNSEFNWILCTEQLVDQFCERYLWVAILAPGDLLFFLEYLANGIQIQTAGTLSDLPSFENFIRPALRLGNDDPDNPFKFFHRPYPIRQRLFGLTQTNVNSLTPGEYVILAGWTTRLTRAANLVNFLTQRSAMWPRGH